MALVIRVQPKIKNGLETWTVSVNGTVLNTFMSKAAAESKKQQVMYAWNVEHVGQRKKAS